MTPYYSEESSESELFRQMRSESAAFTQPLTVPIYQQTGSLITRISHRHLHASSRVMPRAQEKPSGSEPLPPRENDLLERLSALPDPSPPRSSRSRISEADSLVQELVKYLRGSLSSDIERFFNAPLRLLTAASLAIPFGFFSATAATTIFGAIAAWDPLAAAVLLFWVEGFTKYYYGLKKKSKLLQLINAFKVGLIFGMAVDAFKLST